MSSKSFEHLRIDELHSIAEQLNIPNRTSMSKKQLLDAIARKAFADTQHAQQRVSGQGSEALNTTRHSRFFDLCKCLLPRRRR